MMQPIFYVGTIKHPTDSDSHAWRDKWCVNCVNMWVATLGHDLTVENAVGEHVVIVLHEITHALSGVHNCAPNSDASAWDRFLHKLLG